MADSSKPWEDRLWENIAVGPECWHWMGHKNAQGYGRIRVDGKRMGAHCASYIFAIGPIPEGLVIDHACNNPSCVNPAHLFPKTQQANVLRGRGPAAIAGGREHCARGHEYTEANTRIRVRHGTERRVCRQCETEQKRERRKINGK